jgi:hypothetical protein
MCGIPDERRGTTRSRAVDFFWRIGAVDARRKSTVVLEYVCARYYPAVVLLCPPPCDLADSQRALGVEQD